MKLYYVEFRDETLSEIMKCLETDYYDDEEHDLSDTGYMDLTYLMDKKFRKRRIYLIDMLFSKYKSIKFIPSGYYRVDNSNENEYVYSKICSEVTKFLRNKKINNLI